MFNVVYNKAFCLDLNNASTYATRLRNNGVPGCEHTYARRCCYYYYSYRSSSRYTMNSVSLSSSYKEMHTNNIK